MTEHHQYWAGTTQVRGDAVPAVPPVRGGTTSTTPPFPRQHREVPVPGAVLVPLGRYRLGTTQGRDS